MCRAGRASVFEHIFDVDEHYVAEMIDRAKVLAEDPLRCQSLPHMTLAGWDVLELIMETKARDYPHWFSLTKDGNRWHWVNRPLGIEQSFTFLDEVDAALSVHSSTSCGRRKATGRCRTNATGRSGWMRALPPVQADWSVDFDVGMNFHEWHAPVPLAHEKGVFDRALKFLLKLQHGAPVRRFNWTMTVNPLLDTAPETYPKWGPTKTHDHAGESGPETASAGRTAKPVPPAPVQRDCLRHPLLSGQFRRDRHRPEMGAAACIGCCATCRTELATYKGFIRNRDAMVQWLSKYDDGAPTSPGWWPDD